MAGAMRDRHTPVAVLGRIGLWFWIAASMIPFVFMLVTSIKPAGDATSIPPSWTFKPTGANFRTVWFGENGSPHFAALMLHSVIVTGTVTAATTLFGLLAAYGLCIPALRRSKFISDWILSTYMFPPVVAVVPVFFAESRLHLVGSYVGLILPAISFNMPIVVWLVRRGIQELPIALEEAAMIDGAHRMMILRKIILPLITPTVATAAILTAILSWNEFLFAVSLTSGATQTAPVAVLSFTGMYGTSWGPLSAASVVITAPIVILALTVRRRLVSGLTLGAVQ